MTQAFSCGQRRLQDRSWWMPRLIWHFPGAHVKLLVLSCQDSDYSKSLSTILIKASVIIQTESILMTILECVFIKKITISFLQNSVHHQSNQYQPSTSFYVSYISYMYFKHINLFLILAFKILFRHKCQMAKSDFFFILHPCLHT